MKCVNCDASIPRGKMQCTFCGKWNVPEHGGSSRGRVKLKDAANESVERLATKAVGAKAMNGGYPKKCSVLLGGEPGTGKSTMALQVCAHFESALYLASEESSDEIRTRAERLDKKLLDIVEVYQCTPGETWIGDALEGPPCKVVVLDSLPGLCGDDSIASVAVLKALKKHIVEHGTVAIVIDHATKSDFFAGRLTLQHEVDATIVFTCDTPTGRKLVSVKNRHGPSGKEEDLELTEHGLVPRDEGE